ncbi:hypothetical protein ACFL2Q_17105 [Thermodesulfobacteriota bacterium]
MTRCPILIRLFPCIDKRFRAVFKRWGFTNDVWEWLLRRSNRRNNDFVGLISVLLEEGMFPPETKESNPSCESDIEGKDVPKSYEIVWVENEHSESFEGFSKAFPAIVAEGDLSLRVERLLAEGCRSLLTTNALNPVFLVFSSHFGRRRISAFGTNTWTESDKGSLRKATRRVVHEHGADSAMMLVRIDLPEKETGKSNDLPAEAVVVVARDAKSYLQGLLPAEKIDGINVFEEPTVRPTKDNWFSEYTFPVEPASKQTRRKAAR